MTNPLILFLSEIFTRLKTKSPKFFQIWQLISGIVVAVSGLPGFLQMLSITLPPQFLVLENKTVAVAASVAFLMSALTTQGTSVVVDGSGTVLKKTNEKNLPFTAQVEQKSAEKTNVPVNKSI